MAIDPQWRPIGHRQRDQWAAAAQQLGLRHYRGTVRIAPLITGTIDGFDLHITCTDDRSDAPKPVTVYNIDYRPIGGPIRIARETTLTKVGVMSRMIEVADLQIGDREFDKLALIEAADIETAKAFLTPNRRRVISEFFGNASLREGVVSEARTTFKTRRVEGSKNRLIGNTLGMVQFARILTSRQSTGQLAPMENLAPETPLRSYFEDPSESDIQDELKPY